MSPGSERESTWPTGRSIGAAPSPVTPSDESGRLSTTPIRTVTAVVRVGRHRGTVARSCVPDASTTVPRMPSKSTTSSAAFGLKDSPVIVTVSPAATCAGLTDEITGFTIARAVKAGGAPAMPANLARTS